MRLYLDTGLASSKNMTKTKTNNKKEKGETVREDDSFTCQQSLGAKMEKRKSKATMAFLPQCKISLKTKLHTFNQTTSALLDMEEICRIPMEIALQNVGRQYSTEWGKLDPTVTDDMATSSGSAEEKRLQTLKK